MLKMIDELALKYNGISLKRVEGIHAPHVREITEEPKNISKESRRYP